MADFKSLVEETKRQTQVLNQIAGNPAESPAMETVAKEIVEQGKDARRVAAGVKAAATRKERAEAQQQKALAGNASAETEKNRLQERMTSGILKGISGLKTGIMSLSTSFGSFAKEKANALRGGLMGILKKAAFGAAAIAIIAFLNSKYWVDTKKYIMDTIVPAIQRFYEGTLKPFGEGIMKFFEDPTFENFKNIFDVENPLGLVVGLAGIATLLAPGLMFKGLKLGVKAFTAAAKLAGTSLMNLGSDVETGKDGKTRDKKTGNFAKKDTGKLKGMKNLGKGLLRGAKFLPLVGVGVTALMGVFDGVTAGLEEAKNENATKSSILRESIAGIGSGLTFGLVSQETISKGITSMATSVSAGFDKTKEAFNTYLGPDAQWSKDLTAKTQAGIESLKQSGAEVVGKIKEGFAKVISFVTELELFQFVEGKITEIWTSIKSIFSGDFSLENFTAIFGNLLDIVSEPINMVVNKVKDMFGFGEEGVEFKLQDFIIDGLKKIGEFFTGLFDLDIRGLASSIMPAAAVDFLFGKKVDTQSDEFKSMDAIDQAQETGLFNKNILGKSVVNENLIGNATNEQLQAILDDDDVDKKTEELLRAELVKRKLKKPAIAPANDNVKTGQAINDSSAELTTAQAQSNNVVIVGGPPNRTPPPSAPIVPLPVATRDSSSSAANSARVYY